MRPQPPSLFAEELKQNGAYSWSAGIETRDNFLWILICFVRMCLFFSVWHLSGLLLWVGKLEGRKGMGYGGEFIIIRFFIFYI